MSDDLNDAWEKRVRRARKIVELKERLAPDAETVNDILLDAVCALAAIVLDEQAHP